MTDAALDDELLQHLRDEFLDHGRRAAEYLRAAESLVQLPSDALPRQGEMIAYAVREALKAITASQPIGEPGRWRVASRRVVQIKDRATSTVIDREAALTELFDAIDEMAQTHDQERIHQRRLLAVLLNRTGAEPLASGTEPATAYQDLLDRADRAVHGDVDVETAQELWAECVAIVRRLFSPPEIRHRRLEELAQLTEVGSEDVQTALGLIAAPTHMVHLLKSAATPAWFAALAADGALDPPEGPAAWPAYAGVHRHKEEHAGVLATALEGILSRVGASADRRAHLARAATELGPDGRAILIKILGMDPSARNVASFAVHAAEDAPPHDEFVEKVADLVLTPAIWQRSDHYVTPVLGALASGTTADNYLTRLRLLGYKLRQVPEEDLDRRHFGYDSGPLAGGRQHREREPFNALIATVTDVLQGAATVVPIEELLVATEDLPDFVRPRVRTWLLGEVGAAPLASLIDEIANGVQTRAPTQDDLPLLDRVVADSSPEDYEQRWRDALGPALGVLAVSEALAARTLPIETLNRFQWAGILPPPITAEWQPTLAVVTAVYGPLDRRRLVSVAAMEVGTGQAPVTKTDLAAMPVAEAVDWIRNWRPDPNQWLVSARELGRTLQEVVSEAAPVWTTTVVATISGLWHPTYIQHYLAGVTSALPFDDAPIEQLIDAVLSTRAHPWDPVPLGRDDFDYDATWRPTELAGVALLKALADKDAGFAGRDDEVWDVLEAEALDATEPSAIVSPDREPLTRAINRPCTRALEAVLSFAAYKYRASGEVDARVTSVLDRVLDSAGEDGAEYRAILATHLGFLERIIPVWVEEHGSRIFGDEAPDDLGQVSLDVFLRYSRPLNRNVMEKYVDRIRDAVGRDVDNAVEHYVLAMLEGLSGYGVQECVRTLKALDRLSDAGEALGRLLDEDDPRPEHVTIALEFWEAAIGTGVVHLDGFGWFAEVKAIDDAAWADLTARTLAATHGRIDWSHEVADRAAHRPITQTRLSILDAMVRGLEKDWDQRRVGEIARGVVTSELALRDTAEFRRLNTALAERGYLT